jgi:catechol 2,3-dioxygenase-like lactoylglutathione lyase family enzyme
MSESTVPEHARDAFFAGCRAGDVATLRACLEREPTLVHERDGLGSTALHAAIAHVDAVRVLLEHGADPNARDQGDNANFALAAPDGLMHKTPQYDMADLLIELGADVEAVDDKGRTPLEVAMLHGDLEAMRRLKVAGAKEPVAVDPTGIDGGLAALSDSIRRHEPMFTVPDMAATVAWYTALGFTLQERHPEDGEMDWASLSCKSAIMLVPGHGRTSLWFYTDRIDDLYQFLRSRQIKAAHAALAGEDVPQVRFDAGLHEPFYGGRQVQRP